MAQRTRIHGIAPQIALGVKLHFRNKLALFYSYLFPTIFLLAYWALYRHESVPLARHLGELLTVTVLGGACFGLPTSLVSERERGLWRRYRIAPVTTLRLLATAISARYLLLLTAALLQIGLAMLVFGMPAPAHPFQSLLAFTVVAGAFMGLGLVIAAMADNVPAVQALGQVIFLPMLIIGGIAVPIATLPEWAQVLSSYFPGRYAVEVIQSTATGDGFGSAPFAAFALTAIGLAAAVAGVKMFRWDAGQRFAIVGAKSWLTFAVLAWVAVGTAATADRFLERDGGLPAAGRPLPVMPPLADEGGAGAAAPTTGAQAARPPSAAPPAGDGGEDAAATVAAGTNDVATRTEPSPGEPRADTTAVALGPSAGDAGADGAPAAPGTDAAVDAGPASESPANTPGTGAGQDPAGAPLGEPDVLPWQRLTEEELRAPPIYRGLPPDDGVVAPIAPFYAPYPEAECLRRRLPEWEPAKVSDPVQRVRNLLYVAALPDVLKYEEIEPTIPLVVLERLQHEFGADQLTRLLYWVATNPFDGDDSAAFEVDGMCLDIPWVDLLEVRVRAGIYAAKLLGRLTGVR